MMWTGHGNRAGNRSGNGGTIKPTCKYSSESAAVLFEMCFARVAVSTGFIAGACEFIVSKRKLRN